MKIYVLVSCLLGLSLAEKFDQDILDNVKRGLLTEDCWGTEVKIKNHEKIKDAINTCQDKELEFSLTEIFGDKYQKYEKPRSPKRIDEEREGPFNILFGSRDNTKNEEEEDDNEEARETTTKSPAQNQQEEDQERQRQKQPDTDSPNWQTTTMRGTPGMNKVAPNMDKELRLLDEEVGDLLRSKLYKLSNLTCVMKELNKWTDGEDINIEHYTDEMWKDVQVEESFKKKMTDGYNACYNYATSIPLDEMSSDPVWTRFGVRFKFEKCKQKMEEVLCAKNLLKRWLGDKFGGPNNVDKVYDQLSMGKDKEEINEFELAYMAHEAMMNGRSTESRFIRHFINTGEISI